MKQNIRTKLFCPDPDRRPGPDRSDRLREQRRHSGPPRDLRHQHPLLEESGGTVGTVLLSVNPEIEMDYNDVGNVVALTGRNQEAQTLLASYTGYEGRPCTQVVGELVDEINALGYFDATVGGHEKKHHPEAGAGLRLPQ